MRENVVMKPLATKTVLVRGEKWKIRVLSNDSFTELYGTNCAGITLLDRKLIDIPVQEVNFVTILHEIFHAYASYLHLNSANIEGHQSEEIFAELFSSYGVQMISLAAFITNLFGAKLQVQQSDLVAKLSQDQRAFVLQQSPPLRQQKRT